MGKTSKKRILRENDLLEKLAEIEHNQWIHYSKSVAKAIQNAHSRDEILDNTIFKWKKNWIPYDRLSEKEKQKDRIWSRKVLRIVRTAIH